MPGPEPLTEEELVLPMIRAMPEALAVYDKLVEERNRQLEWERRHFQGVMRFLMTRRASQREVRALRAERESELRKIAKEFAEKVGQLVKSLRQRSVLKS